MLLAKHLLLSLREMVQKEKIDNRDHILRKQRNNARPASAAKSKGFSVFIVNLPIDATTEQLLIDIAEIRTHNSKLRSNQNLTRFLLIHIFSLQSLFNVLKFYYSCFQLRPNCFGFVELETVTSMLTAISIVNGLVFKCKIY